MIQMDFMAQYKRASCDTESETDEEKRERIRKNRDKQIDNILTPTSEISTNISTSNR